MHVCPGCQGRHQDRTTFTVTQPGACQALAVDQTAGRALRVCGGLICAVHGCHRQQDHAPQPARAAAS